MRGCCSLCCQVRVSFLIVSKSSLLLSAFDSSQGDARFDAYLEVFGRLDSYTREFFLGQWKAFRLDHFSSAHMMRVFSALLAEPCTVVFCGV
jgi:hypothetical protein